MRIIAGEFKGFPLVTPQGAGTRPTIDRVRESVMSSVASARGGFDGAVVLDAFAGSGALGLEAISRGAQEAWFTDVSSEALRAVTENARKMRLGSQRARIRRVDVLATPLRFIQPPFDLVFLDPPYAYAAREVLLCAAAMRANGAIAPDAIVVYEHALSANADADEAARDAGMRVVRRKKFGSTTVDLMEFCSGSGETTAEDADEATAETPGLEFDGKAGKECDGEFDTECDKGAVE